MFNKNNELIKRAKDGDTHAIDEIFELNLGLVKKVASKFQGRGIEFEDAVQIGSIGLYKAISKFDFSYDVQFSTYAVPMIMGEIKRFLRDDGIVKVSRSIKENHFKINYFLEECRKKNMAEPTVNEISQKLSIALDDVIMALSFSPVCESLNAQTSSEDKTSLEDKLSTGVDEEEKLIENISLYEVIDKLPKRERMIIELRYFKDATQSEVAKLLNISQVQVSRIEKKILAELKNKLIFS